MYKRLKNNTRKFFDGGNITEEEVIAAIKKEEQRLKVFNEEKEKKIKEGAAGALLIDMDKRLAESKGNPELIKAFQKALGVADDSIWGNVSQAAFNRKRQSFYKDTVEGKDHINNIKKIQAKMGITVDGIWGPKSQRAYDHVIKLQQQMNINGASLSEDGILGNNTIAAANNRKPMFENKTLPLATLNAVTDIKGNILRKGGIFYSTLKK